MRWRNSVYTIPSFLKQWQKRCWGRGGGLDKDGQTMLPFIPDPTIAMWAAYHITAQHSKARHAHVRSSL